MLQTKRPVSKNSAEMINEVLLTAVKTILPPVAPFCHRYEINDNDITEYIRNAPYFVNRDAKPVSQESFLEVKWTLKSIMEKLTAPDIKYALAGEERFHLDQLIFLYDDYCGIRNMKPELPCVGTYRTRKCLYSDCVQSVMVYGNEDSQCEPEKAKELYRKLTDPRMFLSTKKYADIIWTIGEVPTIYDVSGNAYSDYKRIMEYSIREYVTDEDNP